MFTHTASFEDAKSLLMHADVIIASDMNMNILFLQPERSLSRDDSDTIYLIDSKDSKRSGRLFEFPKERNLHADISDKGDISILQDDGKRWFLEPCMRIKVNL